MLKRDDRTIWTTYKRASVKNLARAVTSHSTSSLNGAEDDA